MAKNPFLWWLPEEKETAKETVKAAKVAKPAPAKPAPAKPVPAKAALAKPAKPVPAKLAKPAKASKAPKTARPANAAKPAAKPVAKPAARPRPAAPARGLDAAGLEALPGQLIRRAQQIAVAIFLEESGGLTPVQHAALSAVAANPGADATRIAGLIGLDRTTISGVLERLEARGLIGRAANEADRRAKTLVATASGKALVRKVGPAVASAQERLLAPLSGAERAQLVTLLDKLVTLNNDASRAPRKMPDEA